MALAPVCVWFRTYLRKFPFLQVSLDLILETVDLRDLPLCQVQLRVKFCLGGGDKGDCSMSVEGRRRRIKSALIFAQGSSPPAAQHMPALGLLFADASAGRGGSRSPTKFPRSYVVRTTCSKTAPFPAAIVGSPNPGQKQRERGGSRSNVLMRA